MLLFLHFIHTSNYVIISYKYACANILPTGDTAKHKAGVCVWYTEHFTHDIRLADITEELLKQALYTHYTYLLVFNHLYGLYKHRNI